MSPRALARLAAIVLLLGAYLPCWAVARAFGGGPGWVRRFLGQVGWLLGLRVTAVGAPAPAPVLFAANHISWLDILALGGATEARFIAKAEIARWPLVGRLAAIGGSVFVDRERRAATALQADAVGTALGEARPVVLFAEGGTGDGLALAPFRPALFAAAAGRAGTAVQPVAIDYGARAGEIAWPDDTSFSTEMKRILNRRGTIPVALRFAPALDGAGDRKRLAADAHAAVAAALRPFVLSRD